MNSFDKLQALYNSLVNAKTAQNLKKYENKNARWSFQLPSSDNNIQINELDIIAAIEAEIEIQKERAGWLEIIDKAFIEKDNDTLMVHLAKYLGRNNESN